jgi:hypothetical protein
MTSAPEPLTMRDEQLFELLEHPEHWPDDPELQARLAEALELHLGLRAHSDDLDSALRGTSRHAWFLQPWLAAAAAVLLAVIPTVFAMQHSRYLAQQRQDTEHIQSIAQRRSLERNWVAFLGQSATLLDEFQRNPPVCGKDREHEDRNTERQLAMLLMQQSNGLASQLPPVPEADAIRGRLHDWLRELSLEDGCMTTERAEQLRKLAKAQNLSNQVERLSKRLSAGAS